MTAVLVPVEPTDLMTYVRPVIPLLEPALNREGDLSTPHLFQAVATGQMQLWVAKDGEEVIGACITKLIIRPHRKVVQVLYAGGQKMQEWAGCLAEIEGWAKAMGANRVQIVGRKGWRRVLEGYRVENVVLVKDLT